MVNSIGTDPPALVPEIAEILPHAFAIRTGIATRSLNDCSHEARLVGSMFSSSSSSTSSLSVPFLVR